jgi:nitronate monooxygenase
MWHHTRLTETLGIRYPIIQGPFGGGMSSVALAAAVSEAGGLGSFGAHHLNPDAIRTLVADLKGATGASFAVNLWVPTAEEQAADTLSPEAFAGFVATLRPYLRELGLPEPAQPSRVGQDYEAQVAAVLEARPPVLSFIFGIPSPAILAACREKGIRTIGTATHVDEAVALAEAGVDVVVASGSEAGGHRASFRHPPEESPAISALIPQVADRLTIPVVAAGGIADGRGLVSALALGADGVQVGTAFLACEESAASPAHRTALLSDDARHTRLTRVFSGRLARGIRNRFMTEMEASGAAMPPYPLQNWLTQPIRQAAGRAGQADLLALWAGQNAPLVRPRKAADLMAFLLADADRVLQAMTGRLQGS